MMLKKLPAVHNRTTPLSHKSSRLYKKQLKLKNSDCPPASDSAVTQKQPPFAILQKAAFAGAACAPGAPDRSRTCGLKSRSLALYPTELRARKRISARETRAFYFILSLLRRAGSDQGIPPRRRHRECRLQGSFPGTPHRRELRALSSPQ